MHLEVLIAFFLASVPKGLALVMRDTYTPQGQITQYLVAHNSVRVQHGAQALVYSQELAMKAQQWADQCVFEHSGGSLGPFGENLAAGAGTGSNYQFTIAAAVKGWTDEVSESTCMLYLCRLDLNIDVMQRIIMLRIPSLHILHKLFGKEPKRSDVRSKLGVMAYLIPNLG